MALLRVTPQISPDGDTYLIVLSDNGSTDRIGPLRDGEELMSILDDPEVSQGRAPPNRRTKKLSIKQERRNAEMIGGRTQPGSGSSSRAKGDVRKIGEYRGESKFTFAQSYPLARATLEKILAECRDGEKPILFLDYKNKDTGRTHGSYVVLHETDFERLVNHAPADHQGSTRTKRSRA